MQFRILGGRTIGEIEMTDDDKIAGRLASGAMYCLLVSFIMPRYRFAYAAAVGGAALFASLLLLRCSMRWSGRDPFRRLWRRIAWICDMRFAWWLLLCGCVLYAQGRVCGGRAFFATAALSFAGELFLGVLPKRKRRG